MTTYAISGMHCNACVKRIEAAVSAAAPTSKPKVTLTPPALDIDDAAVDFDVLRKAVARAGAYELSASAPSPAPAPAHAPAPRPAPASTLQASVAVPISAIKRAPVKLTTEPTNAAPPEAKAASWFTTYRPLLTIVGYILLVTILAQAPAIAAGTFNGETWMRHFMAGFFLTFSFFKLLDVRSFADVYRGYDLLAARWPTWGWMYPFVELALGVAYLINVAPRLTNAVTFVVMTFSALGVIRAVMNRQQIRCACLGAVFNLPMSTVTIVEDVLMAGMALVMLL
jgi:copper chaperone CopZ